jgi:hypothetical protein
MVIEEERIEVLNLNPLQNPNSRDLHVVWCYWIIGKMKIGP